MWLLKDSPALLTDLYELTMAQVYWQKGQNETASFEVTIRRLPENWGFFVMAGLAELEEYLDRLAFSGDDIDYLRTTGKFSDDFLQYLRDLKVETSVRALPEGTVFFAKEPIVEVTGPLIGAQIIESYVLNILGFSIITATAAARLSIAAKGRSLVDFALRRAQGPVAAVRAARAAMMAGFDATSNVLAAKILDFKPSGTMAHSFVQAAPSEEAAFADFAETYGSDAILLVDTWDSIEGIIKAAAIACRCRHHKGVEIRGIRIDSGDLVELSKFARKHFREQGLGFLRIFVSGDLDEYKIAKLIAAGAEIDGFGVGTRFGVSSGAPSADIVYKLAQYAGRDVCKTSPDKATLPGRKKVARVTNEHFEKDIISPLSPAEANSPANRNEDLLRPFTTSKDMGTISERLAEQLRRLPQPVKRIEHPAEYPIEFDF